MCSCVCLCVCMCMCECASMCMCVRKESSLKGANLFLFSGSEQAPHLNRMNMSCPSLSDREVWLYYRCVRAAAKAIVTNTLSTEVQLMHGGSSPGGRLTSDHDLSTLSPGSECTVLRLPQRERWNISNPDILFSVIESLKHPFPALPQPWRGWVYMLAPWNHRGLNRRAVTF